jgi:hypothetical protein
MAVAALIVDLIFGGFALITSDIMNRSANHGGSPKPQAPRARQPAPGVTQPSIDTMSPIMPAASKRFWANRQSPKGDAAPDGAAPNLC